MMESEVLVHCKELSLDMYNFYTRQDMPQSWSFDGEPEFQLDRFTCNHFDMNSCHVFQPKS